jgi:hypothetical protein
MSASCECCLLSGRDICDGLINHLSRGVLRSVACLCVISKPRYSGGLDPVGLLYSHANKLSLMY